MGAHVAPHQVARSRVFSVPKRGKRENMHTRVAEKSIPLAVLPDRDHPIKLPTSQDRWECSGPIGWSRSG